MASEPLKPTPRSGAPAAPAAPVEPPRPTKIPSLFRGVDWLSFTLTAVLVLIGYLYTIAPDLTLEDSGELAVASMYAGVPHPPGYPVWTIYTWFFTKIIPFGNIAWRVGVSSAVAGALACGLIALMVSRGSSMFVESVAEFKTIERRVENWICLVCGFVSGVLIGFNGFMWSQAVIVEVYTLSMLSLVGVLCCLLRWTHGPTQYRYFYFAWFLCGIAFNNHQSLLVITVAMEILGIVAQPKLGRSLLFWNTVAWAAGLILNSQGSLSLLSGNVPVMLVFCAVGISSLVGWVYLSIKTKAQAGDFLQEGILAATALIMLAWKGMGAMIGALGLELLVFLAIDIYNRSQSTASPWSPIWRKSIASFLAFMAGAAFYLYMPLASMTNPPLNWGYPRTVAGFIHAFTRGQYERIHPTSGTGNNIVEQTFNWVSRYAQQTWWILIKGPIEEFNLVYVLIAFVPLFFFRRLNRRERAWLIGLVAFYIVLGPFLLELFNPAPDRQSLSLNKPFFIASHIIIAMLIGHGLTLFLAELATAYHRFRRVALIGLIVATLLAIFGVAETYHATPYWVLRFTSIVGLVLAIIATLLIVVSRAKAPMGALLIVIMLMPTWVMFGHWSENEQRGHLFGFWFGHDMFTPPFVGKKGELTYSRAEREELLKTPQGKANIYPEMAKDAILFGGTDPGRFCPTYMIFCESFINPKDRRNPEFDRRDVYLITQNALADGTYLQYIRAHYFRSDEYPYDTPFFQDLMRSEKEKGTTRTNLAAQLIAAPLDNLFINKIGDNVEKARRAGSSMFEPDHFTDLASFAKKLSQAGGPTELSKYLRDHLSPETQKMLGGAADKGLAKRLAADLNALLNNELEGTQQLKSMKTEATDIDQQIGFAKPSEQKKLQQRKAEIGKKTEFYSGIVPLYTPQRFQGVTLTPYLQRFIKQNPQYHSRIRMNRLLLEAAYPEIAKSPGGVYPDMEIYTPTPEDSQKCFQEYMADAQQRMSRNQLKAGEDVRVIDNKVQVSGQVAVMAINGLLTKVIFEHNPDNEFYVEESFPLDWMYPHLTPFGIIMKINREQLKELSQEIVDRDHHFWTEYAQRLIGKWITYETPVSNITAFAESVYVNKDYSKFTGDPRFVRDDDGQKAFSKLRSSIAGVYAWRLQQAQPGTANYERMLKEAEFAFKQAYAFCPYSPEALYRYVNLLAGVRRFDDAVLLAKTSRRLDPGNTQLDRLIEELDRLRAGTGPAAASTPMTPQLQKLEEQYAANKGNFATAVAYAQEAARAGDVGRVVRVADDIIANPAADAAAVQFAMQIYAQPQIQDFKKLETALKRWTTMNPGAESWLDLAGAQAMQDKIPDTIASLRQSITLNAQKRATDPKASNIIPSIIADPRFAKIKEHPEFKALLTNR